MSTFLFDKIIFGPVKSRRLGVSLGINLLPTNVKVCSFNCIYCECGFTPKSYSDNIIFPTRKEVREKLKVKLLNMVEANELPDVITFAGNGEPTLHPEFAGIINDTIELRDEITPLAKIAVLSNTTMLHRNSVFEALQKVDDNIQKLDSAIEETVAAIDCPRGTYNLSKTVKNLTAFNGNVIIQTLFVKGSYNGKVINNTTEKEVKAWLNLIKEIKPNQVMIYTIARDTPVDTLEKVTLDELNEIAKQVQEAGFNVQVSG
jgi:wyosine [tRNA(Phe)-imidazoG37] synthetase (radical SAM superfamily)